MPEGQVSEPLSRCPQGAPANSSLSRGAAETPDEAGPRRRLQRLARRHTGVAALWRFSASRCPVPLLPLHFNHSLPSQLSFSCSYLSPLSFLFSLFVSLNHLFAFTSGTHRHSHGYHIHRLQSSAPLLIAINVIITLTSIITTTIAIPSPPQQLLSPPRHRHERLPLHCRATDALAWRLTNKSLANTSCRGFSARPRDSPPFTSPAPCCGRPRGSDRGSTLSTLVQNLTKLCCLSLGNGR